MHALTQDLLVHAMILTFAWVPFALGAWLVESPLWARLRHPRPRFVRQPGPPRGLAPAH